jgi:CHAT domain-containing protein
VNGFLQLEDIYNLKLRAELVVLSACRTALGKEVRGEGLVGMTRAFMYAGAPRVIASLWAVPDRATSEFMRLFYRHFFEGQSPAAALRSAQLELRKTPRWSAPFFWAGFILQGEPD